MLVGVLGTVKEIREDGILLATEEGDILVLNYCNDQVLDINKLELQPGDPIKTLGIVVHMTEAELTIFEPTYIVNKTTRKYIPPLHW